MLIDTYDILKSGAVNAIRVAKEVLEPMGKRLKGVRIDSGDLAYFSKKLSVLATTLTVAGVSVGQVLAFNLHTLQDDNFTEMNSVIIFGIIPRALILIAVAAIFNNC